MRREQSDREEPLRLLVLALPLLTMCLADRAFGGDDSLGALLAGMVAVVGLALTLLIGRLFFVSN